MLNFLSTLGAQSQFQKNRLILTRPNLDQPQQQSMKKEILNTFLGQDEQTRSQIAFASIIKKIHDSTLKKDWLYLLKNILILDRVMNQNRFCQEIAQTNLITVQNFIDSDIKTQVIGAKSFLNKFWRLVQNISRLKTQKKHILYYKRSQRATFLKEVSSRKAFEQIKDLQRLFEQSLDIIHTTCGIAYSRQQITSSSPSIPKYYIQFIESKLSQYMCLHLFSKLLTLFSCQYLLIHKLIQIIISTTQIQQNKQALTVNEVNQFGKIVRKFTNNCKQMIKLVQRNRKKKGFQNVQLKEFTSFHQQPILKMIQQYIKQHDDAADNLEASRTNHVVITEDEQGIQRQSMTLKVERKPVIMNRPQQLKRSCRKTIGIYRQTCENSSFHLYYNSYSEQFPHKNMMTLQLITQIRESQSLASSKVTSYKQEILNDLNQGEIFQERFKCVRERTRWTDLICTAKDQSTCSGHSEDSVRKGLNGRDWSCIDLLKQDQISNRVTSV